MSADAIRKAAIAIIVAPSSSASQGFKVLMTKRSPTLRVQPGAHVFPGGGIDEEDGSIEWKQMLSVDRADLAPRLAAIRETFEECGILVERPTSNDTQARSVKVLEEWRTKLHDRKATFLQMCQALRIQPDVDRLVEWSVWITPVIEKRRFYTYFYLCPLPKIAPVTRFQASEAVSADWFEPNDALMLHREGNMKLIPPQWYTLTEFTSLPSIDEIKAAAGRRALPIIQPVFTTDENGAVFSALPGDAAHILTTPTPPPTNRHRLWLSEHEKGNMLYKLDVNIPLWVKEQAKL